MNKKEIAKRSMTKKEKEKCHAIIHSASASAAAVGGSLAQAPGSDSAVIIPIQVGMVVALGSVFGKTIDKSAAKAAIATTGAAAGGRKISQVLVGWIPGWGNALNASTAAAITEGLGWAIANDFANND